MTHGLTNRPIVQKLNPHRSRSLLSLAKLVPCRFTFPHDCRGDSMPCHGNWQELGKGVGLKTADFIWAAGCLDAHNAIDDKLDKRLNPDERHYEWLVAYLGTWNFIYENKLVRIA